MRIPRNLLSVAASGLLITACGSSPAMTTAAGESQKSATQIAHDAFTAVTSVAGLHAKLTQTDKNGPLSIVIDVNQTTGRLVATGTAEEVTVVLVGGKVYATTGGVVHELTGNDRAGFSSFLPSTLGPCLAKQHGGLTKGPITTVNGKQAIEIKDDGDARGASPGSVFISLSDPPLPLRIVATGPTKPGGDKACGSTDTDTTTSAQIDFDYGHGPITVTPPPTISPNQQGQAVEGTGFVVQLPVGWSPSPPRTANGFTTYGLQGPGSLTGEIARFSLTPATPDPAADDLAGEDIRRLALTINGTTTGSTDVHSTEPMHLVTIDGESCARFGTGSTSQGQNADGRSVTCRHAGIGYDFFIAGPASDAASMNAAITAMEAGWHWS